jgi:hypothetical protein
MFMMMKSTIKEEVTATSDKRVRDATRTSRDRLSCAGEMVENI